MHLKKNVNRTSVNSHVSLNLNEQRAASIIWAAFSKWKVIKLIPNWLIQRAYLTPDKTALSFNDETWTFTEVEREIDDACTEIKSEWFTKMGIELRYLVRPMMKWSLSSMHVCFWT